MAQLFARPSWYVPPPRQRFVPSAHVLTVWVRETLINLNGVPVAGESNMTALIYHSAAAVLAGTPTEVVSGVSTNGSGVLGFQIQRFSLTSGDPIYMMLFKDGSPARFAARKFVPSYE